MTKTITTTKTIHAPVRTRIYNKNFIDRFDLIRVHALILIKNSFFKKFRRKIFHDVNNRRFHVESIETIAKISNLSQSALEALAHFSKDSQRFEKWTRRGHRVQHTCTNAPHLSPPHHPSHTHTHTHT